MSTVGNLPNRSVAGGSSSTGGAKGGLLVTQNRFPEHPNADTKLRLVFQELDLNDNNIIEEEGFRRVLKALNFQFSPATVEDLYQRMDVKKGNGVTYSEWMNFAAHYPVLVDALYSRSREAIERAKRESQMDAQREELEELNRKERLANQQHQVAQHELRQQERTIETIRADVENRKADEKERQRLTFDAEKQADYSKTDFITKEREWIAARDAEKAHTKPLVDTQKTLAKLSKNLGAVDDSIANSREKERQLENLLNQAKRETQELVDQAAALNEELASVKQIEKSIFAKQEEAALTTKNWFDQMKAAEAEYLRNQNAANQCRQIELAAGKAVKAVSAKLHEEEINLAPFRERELHHRDLHRDAVNNMDEADNMLRKLESELGDYSARRVQEEEDEHPLLEHEVRLREQRYNLDDRDDVHYDETTRFMSVTGRTDTRQVMNSTRI